MRNLLHPRRCGKLRNEIDYGSIASWNVPSISGRGARLLGESIVTCNEGCDKTGNLDDVLDTDKKRVLKK